MRTRHLKVLALTGALVVALTGCMKMDLDLELQSDDTIDGSMVFAVSEELAELMGTDAETLAEEMRGDMLAEDGPEGATAEPYDDGEFIGSTMTFEGEALDAFSGEESLVITREDDEFVVAGELDLSEGAQEMEGFTDSMDVSVSVTFPGAVTEHDGELDGRTVTWVPVPGERLEMNARGGAEAGALGALGSSSRLLLLAGAGLALLVVIGLVLFFVLRSRRSATPATAAATAYGQAPAGPATYASVPPATATAPATTPPPAPPVAPDAPADTTPPAAPPVAPDAPVAPTPPAAPPVAPDAPEGDQRPS